MTTNRLIFLFLVFLIASIILIFTLFFIDPPYSIPLLIICGLLMIVTSMLVFAEHEGERKKIRQIPEPSLWQRIQVKIQGYAFSHYRKIGNRDIPIFIVRCEDCKQLFEDFIHGFPGFPPSGERFDCPRCG